MTLYTVWNKIIGLLLFLLPLTLQFIESTCDLVVVCTMATIAAIGEGYYIANAKQKVRKMKKNKLWIAVALLATFALWTVLLGLIDVRAIGPEGSQVGFATLNEFLHELTGVNWILYTVTDLLGFVPIAVAFGFVIFGLVQLIKRKSLWKVDRSILALGVFYIVVVAVYVFFEMVVINYRPILVEGVLEASYPSSTTMLVMCVMPTAAMQLNARIKNSVLRRCAVIIIVAFTAFMVIGRLLSGVHWITDIIGGALFSAGLLTLYSAIIDL